MVGELNGQIFGSSGRGEGCNYFPYSFGSSDLPFHLTDRRRGIEGLPSVDTRTVPLLGAVIPPDGMQWAGDAGMIGFIELPGGHAGNGHSATAFALQSAAFSISSLSGMSLDLRTFRLAMSASAATRVGYNHRILA